MSDTMESVEALPDFCTRKQYASLPILADDVLLHGIPVAHVRDILNVESAAIDHLDRYVVESIHHGRRTVLLLISPVVLLRTPVDIFPSINIPVISVIWTFTGLAPAEMETRLVSIFERSLTTSVNNIEHIESQSYNGVAVVKLFLQPTADTNGAISEVIAPEKTR